VDAGLPQIVGGRHDQVEEMLFLLAGELDAPGPRQAKATPGLNQTISFLPGRVFSDAQQKLVRVLSDKFETLGGAPKALRPDLQSAAQFSY